MIKKMMVISFFIFCVLGCNIFGESEIDEGFIFGTPIDGLVFWIDASTDEQITYGTGSEIQDIYDKTNNGNYMNCSANPPTYMANQLNGRGGMVTSVAPTCVVYYTVASSAAGDRFTLFVVSKITIDDLSLNPLDIFLINTAGESAGVDGFAYPSGNLKDPTVITYELDNNNFISIYKNIDLIVDNQSAAGVMVAISDGVAMVNYDTGSTIYEMIFYERWLSTEERLAVENYLMSKWGI